MKSIIPINENITRLKRKGFFVQQSHIINLIVMN